MILKAAQKIMAPYKIDYEYCDWWTAYQIGQRVGSSFSKNERIFLAGDAVHVCSMFRPWAINVRTRLLTRADSLSEGGSGYERQYAGQ